MRENNQMDSVATMNFLAEENVETRRIIKKVLRRNSMQVVDEVVEKKSEDHRLSLLTPPVDLLLKEFSEKRPIETTENQRDK